MQRYHTQHSVEIISLAFLYDVPSNTVKYRHAGSSASPLQVQKQILFESLSGAIGSRLSSRNLNCTLIGAAARALSGRCTLSRRAVPFLPFSCSGSVTSHWMNTVLCASNCSSRAALLSCPASELRSSRATWAGRAGKAERPEGQRDGSPAQPSRGGYRHPAPPAGGERGQGDPRGLPSRPCPAAPGRKPCRCPAPRR